MPGAPEQRGPAWCGWACHVLIAEAAVVHRCLEEGLAASYVSEGALRSREPYVGDLPPGEPSVQVLIQEVAFVDLGLVDSFLLLEVQPLDALQLVEALVEDHHLPSGRCLMLS